MRSIVFLSFVLMSAVSLSSCNHQVKEERLKRIDSLGVHLNYVEEALAEVDSVRIVNRINDIDQTGAWIYDNVTDTLERQPGITFGDFLRTKKYWNQALTRYQEVRRELRYSEGQLAHLRKDIQNSFYSDEEFAGYFETESTSIANLVNATEELKSKYETSNERYQVLKPKVVSIVDSIKSVIYDGKPQAR